MSSVIAEGLDLSALLAVILLVLLEAGLGEAGRGGAGARRGRGGVKTEGAFG